MTKRMDKKQFARHLRQCENSYATLLWQLRRNRCRCNMKFRRQHTIDIYTVDFYCAERKLVVEIDGSDHFTNHGKRHDAARDRFLVSLGIRVLRFTGKQVELETERVLSEIDQALSPSSPNPFSPEYGGEGE